MSNEVVVPLSKNKIILLELASICFVAFSLWMLFDPEAFNRYPKNIIRIVAIVGLSFFSLTSVFGFVKLFDKKPGLILSEQGFIDNTGALSIGFVAWEDVSGFDRVEIASTKLLMVKLYEPQKYIEKATSAWQKKLMQANYKGYGSPVSISSNSLKIKFGELETLMREGLMGARGV